MIDVACFPTGREDFCWQKKVRHQKPQTSFPHCAQGIMTSRGVGNIWNFTPPSKEKQKKATSCEVAKRQMIEFQIRTLFDVSLVD
jgi:hypothetical protein